ncbi:MAG: patatin [Oscillatoriales cyanobacterium]|nr:MAG: patatin [Oscillatoriales cyanobacterium]
MTYKILSIDGGGIRGVLAATMLLEVEQTVLEATGGRLCDYFDAIAGVSAGSMMAAGLAIGQSPRDLLDTLKARGKHIFPRLLREWRKVSLLQFFGNLGLYPHTLGSEIGIANVLRDLLRDPTTQTDPTIADITTVDLLLLAYDVRSRNTTFFASGNQKYGGNKLWYDDLPLWQICTASASAPTYFPPYNLPYGTSGQHLPHIDGGVAANNPDLAVLSHAIRLGHKLDDIAILSIGTGKVTRPHTYDQVNSWGTVEWVTHLPDMFLDPAAEISGDICRQILERDRRNVPYLRLNFELNERYIGERQPGRLRKLNDQPFNRLIFEQTGERRYISESIDDPDLYNDLEQVAKAYITGGTVEHVDGRQQPVREAIEDFILRY